jgi:hypothetical protein
MVSGGRFRCPFCLKKFNSRKRLLDIHTPKCSVRDDYFNNLLHPDEMEVIRQRVYGSLYPVVEIKAKSFEGKALQDEREVYDP